MGDDVGADGRDLSEFLLPAVQGATAEEGTPTTGDEYGGRYDEIGDEDAGGEEGGEQQGDEEGSMRSLQSHVSFVSLPSYMRSKSGMEMDPDRVSFDVVSWSVLVYPPYRRATAAYTLTIWQCARRAFEEQPTSIDSSTHSATCSQRRKSTAFATK